jgi:hypothetical protein
MQDVPKIITNTVNAVRQNVGSTAVAVGYTLGHVMAPNLPQSNLSQIQKSINPWEAAPIGIPYSDEPILKLASWKDVGAILSGAAKTGFENPVLPAIGVGTLGYMLQKKKINDKILSGDVEDIGVDQNPKSMSENPWVKALLYGGGTFAGLKGLNYSRQRGLKMPL